MSHRPLYNLARAGFLLLLFMYWPLHGQTTETPPLLSEQEAVKTALASNRQIQQSNLDIDKASAGISQVRSGFFPQQSVNALAGYPLQEIGLKIPAGSLGTYPTIGPLPSTNTEISSGQKIALVAYATVDQPLSRIYNTHLSLLSARNTRELAKESARTQQQGIAAEVSQAYHQICILEARRDTDRSELQALQETLRTTQNGVARGTALEADALEVKSSLAQQQYDLVHDENAIVSAHEQLNLLMGRDIDTQFLVEALPSLAEEQITLAEARDLALRQRPEIRSAKLQVEKANLDIRQERADYIPNLSAQFTYLGFQNVEFLPNNITSIGLSLQWNAPWDWGRRRAEISSLRSVGKQQILASADTAEKITLDVDQKYRALTEARIQVEAATAASKAKAERLRNLTNQLQQHMALSGDVMQQAAASQKASENYIQALANYWNARADFDRSVGN